MGTIEVPASDVEVGYIADGLLVCSVSVRGGRVVVLTFARERGGLVEVAFSPKAVRQLLEVAEAAAKLAEGRG